MKSYLSKIAVEGRKGRNEGGRKGKKGMRGEKEKWYCMYIMRRKMDQRNRILRAS